MYKKQILHRNGNIAAKLSSQGISYYVADIFNNFEKGIGLKGHLRNTLIRKTEIIQSKNINDSLYNI